MDPTTSIIIAALLIAAVWAVYILPSLLGDRRDAPMSSTEEFDRWTHLMADVQKRPFSRRETTHRDLVRRRRRRTITSLVVLAAFTLALAWTQGSWAWLLVHLFVDSLVGLYWAALSQVRKRRQWRLKVTHVTERTPDWEDSQVRVIAQ